MRTFSVVPTKPSITIPIPTPISTPMSVLPMCTPMITTSTITVTTVLVVASALPTIGLSFSYWVPAKELELSYHNSKTILCTIYPYSGNLIQSP